MSCCLYIPLVSWNAEPLGRMRFPVDRNLDWTAAERGQGRPDFLELVVPAYDVKLEGILPDPEPAQRTDEELRSVYLAIIRTSIQFQR